MANRKRHPIEQNLAEAADIGPELGQTLARTLQLLSNAATLGVCRGRMRNLVRHLAVLAEHPQAGGEVRETSQALLREWREAQAEHFAADADATVTRH